MASLNHLIPAIIIGMCLAACNWQVPTSNEGLIDTVMVVNDERAAKADSTLTHTATADNAQNKDTLAMPPTKEIDTKNVHPAELMSFAETMIGVPYVYGSTNPKVGFDCSGFITHVFNRFGISVPRSSIDFTDVGKPIPKEEAKRGDIILFTGTNPAERFVGHMGLVVSNDDSLRFIHSTSGKAMGVTITPLSKYYLTRFVKTIRIFPQNN